MTRLAMKIGFVATGWQPPCSEMRYNEAGFQYSVLVISKSIKGREPNSDTKTLIQLLYRLGNSTPAKEESRRVAFLISPMGK